MYKYVFITVMIIGILFMLSCSEDDIVKPSNNKDIKWWVLVH